MKRGGNLLAKQMKLTSSSQFRFLNVKQNWVERTFILLLALLASKIMSKHKISKVVTRSSLVNEDFWRIPNWSLP
jgi:hypothetical protein